MIRVGILSDTHGILHPRVLDFFVNVKEIWHAGDIGAYEICEQLSALKPFRAVSGNIDGWDIRAKYPETLVFTVEEVKVVMRHIAGYPGRYDPSTLELINKEKPGLFVSGHSHILKVMYDKKHHHLHINPGAAGKYGLHKSMTAVRFTVDGKEMKDLEVLDIPR
ncbi:MAG: metallophosphoesterase family protein [bacterium]